MTAPVTVAPPVVNQDFPIVITYNGLSKQFRGREVELVRVLLEHALTAFAIQQNRHLQALYSVNGIELNDALSLKAAGIGPDAHLLLRPSAVKGGTR